MQIGTPLPQAVCKRIPLWRTPLSPSATGCLSFDYLAKQCLLCNQKLLFNIYFKLDDKRFVRMWSPSLRGAGGQRSLLICYADWLLSGCLCGCVCRVCVCVCCARVSLRRMFIHISNNTNRTEQTSRCQLPFIYLCLIIIKTGTVAKTMTILRLRHGIEIRIGIFISAFLFQIKKRKRKRFIMYAMICDVIMSAMISFLKP